MSPEQSAGRIQRTIAGLAQLVAGAATGLAAVVVHSSWWGLLLAVGATVAALLALPRRLGARGVFCLGWIVIAGLAVFGRPEGDYAVAATFHGYAFLLLALGVICTALVTLATAGSRRSPTPS